MPITCRGLIQVENICSLLQSLPYDGEFAKNQKDFANHLTQKSLCEFAMAVSCENGRLRFRNSAK